MHKFIDIYINKNHFYLFSTPIGGNRAENVVPEAAMMWNDVETRTPVTTLMWMREAELKVRILSRK